MARPRPPWLFALVPLFAPAVARAEPTVAAPPEPLTTREPPPEPLTTREPPPEPLTTREPPPEPTTSPDEIFVRGHHAPREVTRRTVTREEADVLPGTNGDALRSVQALPGVARPPPFGGQLVVRGSAPEDTTIFVDGVDIPLVYHFGGLASAIPTELLDRIDFTPANYSSVYGRGMGGMVDVGLRLPRADGIHGLAQVDLLDARVLAEGPLPGTDVRFLVAARRSYFDAWLGPVLREANAPASTVPRYYDGQAMLARPLGRRGSVRLVLYGADDALDLVSEAPSASAPTFGGSVRTHTTFWRAQGRLEAKLDAHHDLSAVAAVGHDAITFGFGAQRFEVDQTPVNGRVELTSKLPRFAGIAVRAHVGADVVVAPYTITLRLLPARAPGTASGGPLDVPRASRRSGSRTLPAAYTEWEIGPLARTRILPGLRLDGTSTNESWELSPRVSVRHELVRSSPRSTLKAAVGVFRQPPTPVDTDPVYGQRGLATARALHYDAGIEQELGDDVRLTADAFVKELDRLVIAGAGSTGTGRVVGAEWLLKHEATARGFGWIAYTLSRSTRRDGPDAPQHLSAYDQTHVLTAVASVRLGGGFRLGGRFRFASGGLYTPEHWGTLDATSGTSQSVPDAPPFGARLPSFHQLDLRLDKAWERPGFKITAYLDVQNVTYHRSAEGIAYNHDFTRSTTVSGLPLLPSFGLRGEL